MTDPFASPALDRMLAELGAPGFVQREARTVDRTQLAPTLVLREPPIETAPAPVYDPEKSGRLPRQKRPSRGAVDPTDGRPCCTALAIAMQGEMHRRAVPFSSPCKKCGAVLAVEMRTRVVEEGR